MNAHATAATDGIKLRLEQVRRTFTLATGETTEAVAVGR